MKADHREYVIFILAQCYSDAENYARIYLHDQQAYTFIEGPMQLKGLRGLHFVHLPNWSKRADAVELSNELLLLGAVDITNDLPQIR